MNARAILSTLPERLKQQQEEKLYKSYIARIVRLSGENIAKTCQGSYISVDFDDILDPKPVDNRSADEIINGIKDKIKKLND